MVYRGGIFGSECYNFPNPYLNSAIIPFDISYRNID